MASRRTLFGEMLESRRLLASHIGEITAYQTETIPLEGILEADFRVRQSLQWDINADGRTDAILSSISSVAVLEANDAESFDRVYSQAFSEIREIEVLAFNNDEWLDLVVRTVDGIVPLINGGIRSGVWQGYIPGATLSAPRTDSFDMADINADGRIDVAFSTAQSVEVRFGRDDGTFGPATRYLSTMDAARDVALGDVTGDGLPDLAVGFIGVPDGEVLLLLNGGDGKFEEVPQRVDYFQIERTEDWFVASSTITLVDLVDLDHDGLDELLVGYYYQCRNEKCGLVYIGGSQGDGTFRLQTSLEAVAYPSAISVRDFDQNGLIDVMVEGADDVNLHTGIPKQGRPVLHLRQDGSFVPNRFDGEHRLAFSRDSAGFGVEFIATSFKRYRSRGDVLPQRSYLDTDRVYTRQRNGDLTLTQLRLDGRSRESVQVARGDFNGDGLPDRATSRGRGETRITFGGDNSFITIAMPSEQLQPIDVDRDGVTELIGVGNVRQSSIWLYRDGEVTLLPDYVHTATVIDQASVADFDGDGFDDIALVVSAIEFPRRLELYAGRPDGSYERTIISDIRSFHFEATLSALDVTGDGIDDLIVDDRARGDSLIALSLQPLISADLGDFNRDRKLDWTDIDLLSDARLLTQPTSDQVSTFDLNQDGSVEADDLTVWVEIIARTRHGDVNLDQRVDFDDFVILSGNMGKSDANWRHGDMNTDNVVDIEDFILLSKNFGFA